MALPTYNRNNRRQNTTFEQLPKDAYVVKILGAKLGKNNFGRDALIIQFDIAEGQYKDFYKTQYEQNPNEDKKWSPAGVFQLEIPYDGCDPYVSTNYDSFFADLEDSNSGFRFGGDEKTLKGKLIGAKMRVEHYMRKGYPNTITKMFYTCIADDVRNGKAGRLPKDKYSKDWNPDGNGGNGGAASAMDNYASNGFSSGDDEEIPFD